MRDCGNALVTGAANGIGAAIARGVCAAGGAVLLADIDGERGEALARELGDRASFLHTDATREGDVARACDEAVGRFGRLDTVFANAGGVGVLGAVETTALEDFDQTIRLLLTSVFLAIKHSVRVMQPQGEGSLVITASVASVRGGLGPHVYTAAKHGVLGLVRSVAVQLAPHGLRINAVAPGGTVSALSAGLVGEGPDDLAAAYAYLAEASSSGVPTTAEDVASAAMFLAGAGASRINGTCLVVDGGDDVLASAARSYYN